MQCDFCKYKPEPDSYCENGSIFDAAFNACEEYSPCASDRFPIEKELIRLDYNSSSKGNQVKFISIDKKWYYKQCFFYQNKYWRDDLVEVIAYQLSKQLLGCFPALEQTSVVRFGNYGVFSPTFLMDSDESFMSFGRVLQMHNLQIPLSHGLKTFTAILAVYAKCFGLDALNFLLSQTLLDLLVGNEDRHIYNFGVIVTPTGYRLHPLFDFGLGMFEHDRCYADYSFKDKLSHMQFKTLAESQLELVQQLCSKYPDEMKSLLSFELHPSRFVFPSESAETYLRYVCMQLGVRVCND